MATSEFVTCPEAIVGVPIVNFKSPLEADAFKPVPPRIGLSVASLESTPPALEIIAPAVVPMFTDPVKVGEAVGALAERSVVRLEPISKKLSVELVTVDATRLELASVTSTRDAVTPIPIVPVMLGPVIVGDVSVLLVSVQT